LGAVPNRARSTFARVIGGDTRDEDMEDDFTTLQIPLYLSPPDSPVTGATNFVLFFTFFVRNFVQRLPFLSQNAFVCGSDPFENSNDFERFRTRRCGFR